MFAVTVTFTIKEGQMDAFLPLILKNARASVKDEPGCRQFDVCTDPSHPNTVFLYELYDDEAAFEAHHQMPHYKDTGPAVAGLVADKQLRTFDTVAR
ncbi:putative quinol monooxygenase [uncultured Litoreibacter sp.]|uniref:putative quinol monooxygenase n=1 Tax=uncultured Litoreibacter sp. TaxID=1392394 RepID=UPI0026177769|nr:putative quinol monooxygenase [uncultured Litoreibacter sp.]